MSKHYELLRSLNKNAQEPIKAAVSGTIPKWLNGTLFRNGPGRYEFGDKTYKHLFDGQSCVHKYSIKDGEVFYSNRLLETNAFKKTISENHLFPMFGTADICSNLFGRIKTFFKSSDTRDNVII